MRVGLLASDVLHVIRIAPPLRDDRPVCRMRFQKKVCWPLAASRAVAIPNRETDERRGTGTRVELPVRQLVSEPSDGPESEWAKVCS